MIKRCVYCKTAIEEDRVVDVCDKCGIKVWGEKMFQTIKDNMNQAKMKGDLHQGLVNDELQKSLESKNSFKIKL